jgi:hypothetical protein
MINLSGLEAAPRPVSWLTRDAGQGMPGSIAPAAFTETQTVAL